MTYNPNFTGNNTVPASASVKGTENNNSGFTIAQLTPVRITSTGDLGTVDPSIEAQVQAIAGLVGGDILNGSSGDIVSGGRILNITTASIFGTQLYLSKTGGVTATQPDIGTAGFVVGDFVVSLGVIAKNASNPSNKDFIVRILLVGQL